MGAEAQKQREHAAEAGGKRAVVSAAQEQLSGEGGPDHYEDYVRHSNPFRRCAAGAIQAAIVACKVSSAQI